MNLISILIPTLDSRVDFLNRLLNELNNQIIELFTKEFNAKIDDIKIDVLKEYQSLTIGVRRNILLENATGKYVCFFDDDDLPTDTYISELYNCAISNCDCASMKGIYTVNGQNPEIFEHSIKYNSWKTNVNAVYPSVKYERPPNHLNLIKSEIAKSVLFENITFGEDKLWSDSLFSSGNIKTEYYIKEPIYKYLKIQ